MAGGLLAGVQIFNQWLWNFNQFPKLFFILVNGFHDLPVVGKDHFCCLQNNNNKSFIKHNDAQGRRVNFKILAELLSICAKQRDSFAFKSLSKTLELQSIYSNHQTTASMHQTKIIQEKEYLKIDQFSFRNLTPKYQVRTLEILGQQFYRQEPLTNAYSKKYPNDPCSVTLWSQFFSSFMDDAATNNLSVVVLDTECNDKLIGVFICRDLTFAPQSFIDTFLGKVECPNTFIAELEVELRKQLKPELDKFLNEKGQTVDFWGVAIDQAYVGKKFIFKSMLALVEKLAKEGGYTHGHIYAVNGKTNIVAKKANYQLIARVDATQVMLRNKQPFSQVEQFHKHPSLWLKKL